MKKKSDFKSHTKLAMSNECGSEQDLLHDLQNTKMEKNQNSKFCLSDI